MALPDRGLSGIKIKSESLQTLMAGGIAFDTPRPDVALKRHIPRFRLHDSQEAVNRAGTLITVRVDRADGLKPGTPIRFRGLDVGSIESVDLTNDLQAVLLRARITGRRTVLPVPARSSGWSSQPWAWYAPRTSTR